MRQFLSKAVVFTAFLAVAACGTPRGAGFQAEVLAASRTEEDGTKVYDFSVFDVTKDSLPMLQSWPDLYASNHRWISGREQPASLIIAPGDMLQLTVWDAEENSLLAGTGQRATPLQDIQVSSTGEIFVPYIGELKVSGMSPSTARARIEEELSLTIPSAQVQVSVAPGRANTANLVSGVAAPGVYPLPDRNYKILDLISQAGGVPATLSNPQVRLIRAGEIYRVSLDRLYSEPGLDTTLRGGDRILIEEEERYFLSLGATGVEALHVFPKETVTALDALSIVGGVSDTRANPEGILILREYPGRMVRSDNSGPPHERVVFTLDLTSADGLFSAGNFEIEPNDLVYATESPLGAALTLVGALSTLSGTVQSF